MPGLHSWQLAEEANVCENQVNQLEPSHCPSTKETRAVLGFNYFFIRYFGGGSITKWCVSDNTNTAHLANSSSEESELCD